MGVFFCLFYEAIHYMYILNVFLNIWKKVREEFFMAIEDDKEERKDAGKSI